MGLKNIKRKSTLNRVNSKCDSLKTTIPKSLIEVLGVKPGDKLEWTANWKEGAVVVEPLTSSGNNRGGG